jgi:hypothetical protein
MVLEQILGRESNLILFFLVNFSFGEEVSKN